MTATSGPLALAARTPLSHAAVPATRKKIAVAIAIVADLLQGGLFAASPLASWIPDDVMDVAVAITLVLLLGFRFRLIVALAIELVPGVQLFPSWTAFVLSLPTRPAAPPALSPQNANQNAK